jgi:hypothetical protein
MALAGRPFYISPTELWQMNGEDLAMWLELAEKRIKKENGKSE